tara:strand:+ start:664 stop:1371 length:708 start_codon:yes stop_codon:yes gene_type:complete
MSKYTLEVFEDANALAREASGRWLAAIEKHDGSRPFTIALSGGRIPKVLYDEFVSLRPQSVGNAHFFWGDERCVPPDDEESNFKLAEDNLFSPLSLPELQIHRILGERDDAFAVAQAEAEICRVAELSPDGQPVLDLIFLGMGEDGHVASLFPEDEEAVASTAVYRAVIGPKPPPRRVTLGYPALALAREVWVLAAGAGKREALRASLSGEESTPLERVLQLRTHTRIFTDFDLP